MQDSVDQVALQIEGTEFEIGWQISSPLMLSPTNELSNPFFTMSHGDHSHSLIMDLGISSPLFSFEKKHRLSPQELSLTRSNEDVLELDYFSLDTSIKRQRLQQHPIRQSSASLASTTSSATPSEAAESDILERTIQDEETSLLNQDMASCSIPSQPERLSSNVGLGFNVNHDRNYDDQQHQISSPPSHASLTLNTFNLSDFISDQEHELYQPSYAFDARSSTGFVTPERPLYHRDVRNLTNRSVSYSPVSTNSPSTPQLEDNQFQHSSLRIMVQNDHVFDANDKSMGSHGLFNTRQGQDEVKPKMLMRSYTDPVEILSCNPSQITPNHHRHLMSEDDESSSAGYFLSLHLNEQDMVPNLHPHDEYSNSSLESSPTQDHQNMWTSMEENESKQDVFDGSSSPLYQHQESRPMVHSFSAPSSQSHQKLDVEHFATETRVSVMRSARLSAMAAGRQSSSPYQSPTLQQGGQFDSANEAIDSMPGIITKRSRGRRVPNNPEELNNLGKSGKVYTCKVPGCGKCFKRSEHLKRHVRSIHTNEKPFTCHCGKTFSRHDNLNQHARVHMDSESNPDDESSSVSPSPSPMSLSGSKRLAMKRGSSSLVSSRLRQATNASDEDQEDEEFEANMFVMSGTDFNA